MTILDQVMLCMCQRGSTKIVQCAGHHAKEGFEEAAMLWAFRCHARARPPYKMSLVTRGLFDLPGGCMPTAKLPEGYSALGRSS